MFSFAENGYRYGYPYGTASSFDSSGAPMFDPNYGSASYAPAYQGPPFQGLVYGSGARGAAGGVGSGPGGPAGSLGAEAYNIGQHWAAYYAAQQQGPQAAAAAALAMASAALPNAPQGSDQASPPVEQQPKRGLTIFHADVAKLAAEEIAENMKESKRAKVEHVSATTTI